MLLLPHVTGTHTTVMSVEFSAVPWTAPAMCMWCSDGHDSLFVYVLQARPLLSADPDHGYLFGVQWSPARPLVCALGTADGHILLYDLLVSAASTTMQSLANTAHLGEAVYVGN